VHVPEESLISLRLIILQFGLMALQIVGYIAVEAEIEAVRLVEYLVQLLCDAPLNVFGFPDAH